MLRIIRACFLEHLELEIIFLPDDFVSMWGWGKRLYSMCEKKQRYNQNSADVSRDFLNL
jgi:hypothetical protein